MKSRRTTRLLCIADPRGDAAAIARVLEASRDRDVHAIAVTGDLAGDGAPPKALRVVFRALGESGLAAYWVPGAGDAPVRDYLCEAHTIKGHHGAGSEALAELVNTYRPRLVVSSGPPGSQVLGKSLVVAPGSLAADGCYAVADMHTRELESIERAAR